MTARRPRPMVRANSADPMSDPTSFYRHVRLCTAGCAIRLVAGGASVWEPAAGCDVGHALARLRKKEVH